MRIRLKDTPTTPTPCDLLAAAQAQLAAMLSGKQLRSAETPQLGRVEFAAYNMDDLRRYIYDLQVACAESQGLYTMRRRPISMEAEP